MKRVTTAEKKITGIKIHAGVDVLGPPHGVHVTTANITDRDGALEMLEKYASNMTGGVKLLCDGGYTGENFADAVADFVGASVEIAKRNELHKFLVMPKRWIVERSFA